MQMVESSSGSGAMIPLHGRDGFGNGAGGSSSGSQASPQQVCVCFVRFTHSRKHNSIP